jgi:transposase
MKLITDFFIKPTQTSHKKYEALRAIYVDGVSAEQVAKKFGYSIHTIYSMCRDFSTRFKSNNVSAQDFFYEAQPGPKKNNQLDLLRDEIILLRKQNHSILDIQSTLQAKGHEVSHVYIHELLQKDGFAKLPKRTALERLHAKADKLKAPQSRSLNWTEDLNKTYCSERGIGVLPFLPLMAEMGIHKWIEDAQYPETSEINRLQSILSFIALKLSGHRRYHHDDLWAMDRAYGLISALNVLPKTTTLSSYSSRVKRDMNKSFLKSMNSELKKRNLLSGTFNMDFTAIPHWGDESILENNWSGKRNKALKSVLAGVCQDQDSGVLCYADAELNKKNQNDFILEFVDFWKEDNSAIKCLVFDSKFTIYENLEKLDSDKIKFITLRRRGAKLEEETKAIPENQWQKVIVEGRSRKRKKLLVHDSEVTLNKKIQTKFRQIIVTGNGHEKPSFFITNDREKTTAQLIRQYGKRWNVEKSISEQIEFFHLNSLSSSIVVKVDFDLTMTVVAHNIYRAFAQKLEGFSGETSFSLNNKFFVNSGQFTIEDKTIKVDLKKKRHLPILMESLAQFKDQKIPWLGDRTIEFNMWSKS